MGRRVNLGTRQVQKTKWKKLAWENIGVTQEEVVDFWKRKAGAGDGYHKVEMRSIQRQFCNQCPHMQCHAFFSQKGCAMCSYWWKQSGASRGIHWISWKQMCKGKRYGGMGFRVMELFNKALIAKQGWRLTLNTSSLVYKVLKAKYFSNSTFLIASKLGSQPSYSWRCIYSRKKVLKEGLRWRVTNGQHIRVWKNKWIPTSERFIPAPKGTSLTLTLRWLHVESDQDDRLHGSMSTGIAWNRLWKANIPNKVKVFGWRLCHDILSVYKNLNKRKMVKQATSPRCKQEDESSLHAIKDCIFPAEVRKSAKQKKD
ncbi:uncharacterized protein LOC111279525 [Durio zibethinus]|uniref:Uncharacterized protein LOC111279525 n=1 Tax=Durio zibethinus TaxID=66656 RepID=A0A6P5X301_DURZI|nr:uncharacterized protein LOC111279525 [Durio zibethinus]